MGELKGIESKLDGKGKYRVGIEEEIILGEINMDSIRRIVGMNIRFVRCGERDEEGYGLLKELGLGFKKGKKD